MTGDGKKKNCEFLTSVDPEGIFRVFVFTTRRIATGQQLLLNYSMETYFNMI